jgi:hypothetical protein
MTSSLGTLCIITAAKTTHWQKYVQRNKKTGDCVICVEDVSFVAAEIEFYDELCDTVESGEYVTTVEVETLYTNMMRDHGVVYSPITRRALMAKISENMPNIVISPNRGNLPGVVHFQRAGREGLTEPDR